MAIFNHIPCIHTWICHLGGKCGQHSHWMFVWVSSILDPRHPLRGTEPASYTNIHVVPPGYQPEGEVDYGYLAQYNQAYSECVVLVSLDRLPTKRRREEENSDNKPMGMEVHHQPWQFA